MNRDIDYENRNVGFNDEYPKTIGGGIKCRNFIFCNTILPKPKWWYEFKSDYICSSCIEIFGTQYDVIKTVICVICAETKSGLLLSKCNISMCVDCFKYCENKKY